MILKNNNIYNKSNAITVNFTVKDICNNKNLKFNNSCFIEQLHEDK